MTKDSSPLSPLPDAGSHDDQPRKPRGRKKASAAAETTTESQASTATTAAAAKEVTPKAVTKAKASTPKRAASPKVTRKSAPPVETIGESTAEKVSGADISATAPASAPVTGAQAKKAAGKKDPETTTAATAKKTVRQPRKKAIEAAEPVAVPARAKVAAPEAAPASTPEVSAQISASPVESEPKKTSRTPRASTKAKSSADSAKSSPAEPRKSRSGTSGRRTTAKSAGIASADIAPKSIEPKNIAPGEFSSGNTTPDIAVSAHSTPDLVSGTPGTNISHTPVAPVVAADIPVDASTAASTSVSPTTTSGTSHGAAVGRRKPGNHSRNSGAAAPSPAPRIKAVATSVASYDALDVAPAEAKASNFSEAAASDSSGDILGHVAGDAAGSEESTGRTRRPRRRGGRGRRRNNNTDQAAFPGVEGDVADLRPERSFQGQAGVGHDEIVFNAEAKWEYDEFSLGAGSIESPAVSSLAAGEDVDSSASESSREDDAADDRSSGRDGQRRSRSRGRRSRNKRRNGMELEARSSQDADLNEDADSDQDTFVRSDGSDRSDRTDRASRHGGSLEDDSEDSLDEIRDARPHRQRDTSDSDDDSDLDDDDDLDFDDDLDDDEDDDQSFRRGKRKMFVSVLPGEEVEVVLSEEGQVHEYYVEMLHQAKTKGNIYKGIINNVDANLQAAFVSYGAVKNGFLQIDEVHPEYFLTHHEAGKGRKFPPIQKVLKPGQEILVQVVKEPTGNKGAFLTSYLSIPGRFLVLTPGREQIGVSRKVDEEGERSRLRGLLEGLNPGPGLGVIVRTVSMGASKTSLRSDLQFLKRLWKDVRKNGSTETAPCLIYQEPDLASRAVRDYLTEEVCEIWVDDEGTAEHIRGMAELLYPRRSGLVKLHRDYNQSLWERFNIQKQLDQIQSREVVLPSGGRLVFDQTEALMAIDINTAKATGKSNFESTVLRTNMEAAEIIPRQLKLRDVGGQVVIDFIEMREQSHWRNVEKTLRNAMKTDRARHDIGKISRFGLMEIVRQRLASSAISVSSETCPHCTGTGVRRNLEWQALQSMREINRQMRKAQASNQPKLSYQAEAELALYLLNHKRERLMELEKAYKVQLELQPMPISIG